MLCVVTPDLVGEVAAVCERWEVLCTEIGEVAGHGRLRVFDGEEVVGDLPVAALVDECPMYDLDPEPPTPDLYPRPPAVLRGGETLRELLLALLASPNLASRRPIFEQYDCIVGSRTVRRPDEADAAVLTLPGGAALAISIDGNGRRVACDPRAGAAEAVYECSANLACVGAEPLGLTNCLNFGNPEKPHVAWQLTEAIEGLARACEALEVPVVGGNVSLYNEAPTGPILPTPVVGMVGRLPDASRAGRIGFAAYGDAIALVGPFAPSLVGSETAKLRGLAPAGRLPVMDPSAVRDAHVAVRDAVRSGALSSAHDISEGGLAVALAECCIAGGIGAEVRVEVHSGDEELFGEAPGSGFVVSGPDPAVSALGRVIGRVGGTALVISGQLEVAVSELHRAREGGLVEYASSAVWSE
jgi:phosphoribosylformylglycinamidine synthase